MTALGNDVRVLPGGGASPAQTDRARSVVRLLLVVAAIVALIGVGWEVSSGRRAIRELPPDQRVTLVSRGVDELKRFCGQGRPDSLEEHCRDVASFVAKFDECTGECAVLTHLQLTPTPTR